MKVTITVDDGGPEGVSVSTTADSHVAVGASGSGAVSAGAAPLGPDGVVAVTDAVQTEGVAARADAISAGPAPTDGGAR